MIGRAFLLSSEFWPYTAGSRDFAWERDTGDPSGPRTEVGLTLAELHAL